MHRGLTAWADWEQIAPCQYLHMHYYTVDNVELIYYLYLQVVENHMLT